MNEIEAHYLKIAKTEGLADVRTLAWEGFLERGVPRGFSVSGFGTDVHSEISGDDLAPYRDVDTSGLVVTVNGCYNASLSDVPEKLVVMSLKSAFSPYNAFLRNRWTQAVKQESNSLALLNMAVHQDGLFIYVPSGCCLKKPLQVLHVVDVDQDDGLFNPRLQLFVGRGANLSLNVSMVQWSNCCCSVNYVADYVVEKGAFLSLKQRSQGFFSSRAIVNEGAVFRSETSSEGACEDYHVQLFGKGSEASLRGIWALDDEGKHDVKVYIDHQAPYTRSKQLFKGVLEGNGYSKFEGKVVIQQAAQKAVAYQLNKNLLLSERARAESMPLLEIFADDVKASHGATVGQLDKNQLYYLQSRGIPKKEAKKMLVRGFLEEDV